MILIWQSVSTIHCCCHLIHMHQQRERERGAQCEGNVMNKTNKDQFHVEFIPFFFVVIIDAVSACACSYHTQWLLRPHVDASHTYCLFLTCSSRQLIKWQLTSNWSFNILIESIFELIPIHCYRVRVRSRTHTFTPQFRAMEFVIDNGLFLGPLLI